MTKMPDEESIRSLSVYDQQEAAARIEELQRENEQLRKANSVMVKAPSIYTYTNKRIKSGIWYDRAMKRTFKDKQFTRDQFFHKFISIFLHVEDESNLLNATRRASYVWSTFTKSGNIVKI